MAQLLQQQTQRDGKGSLWRWNYSMEGSMCVNSFYFQLFRKNEYLGFHSVFLRISTQENMFVIHSPLDRHHIKQLGELTERGTYRDVRELV